MHFKQLKFITLFILLSIYFFSCNEDKKHSNVTKVEIKFKKEGELSLLKASNDSLIKTLNIEIADDEYQTQTGLMYRYSMEDNQGMLFIFPDSEYRYFYMRNTEIPLDIITFLAQYIFGFCPGGKPRIDCLLSLNGESC